MKTLLPEIAERDKLNADIQAVLDQQEEKNKIKRRKR